MKPFILRRAIRCTVALTVAVLASHFFLSDGLWILLTTLLLMQTEMGAPVRNTILRFIWILFTLIFASQIELLSSNQWIWIILVPIIVGTSYLYAFNIRRYLSLHLPLLILLVFVTAFSLTHSDSHLMEVLYGTLIALLTLLLVFPDPVDVEFQSRITPLLNHLSTYSRAIISLLLQEPHSAETADLHRREVEKGWWVHDPLFPVWVFEKGYNPELKAGQYFFAIHVSQIMEILFALHYFARYSFERELLQPLTPSIQDYLSKTQELWTHVMQRLNPQKVDSSSSDYIEDMTQLEEKFKTTVNVSLELLDISKDYIYLAAVIRYLKDLRLQLLQLATALR